MREYITEAAIGGVLMRGILNFTAYYLKNICDGANL